MTMRYNGVVWDRVRGPLWGIPQMVHCSWQYRGYRGAQSCHGMLEILILSPSVGWPGMLRQCWLRTAPIDMHKLYRLLGFAIRNLRLCTTIIFPSSMSLDDISKLLQK